MCIRDSLGSDSASDVTAGSGVPIEVQAGAGAAAALVLVLVLVIAVCKVRRPRRSSADLERDEKFDIDSTSPQGAGRAGTGPSPILSPIGQASAQRSSTNSRDSIVRHFIHGAFMMRSSRGLGRGTSESLSLIHISEPTRPY